MNVSIEKEQLISIASGANFHDKTHFVVPFHAVYSDVVRLRANEYGFDLIDINGVFALKPIQYLHLMEFRIPMMLFSPYKEIAMSSARLETTTKRTVNV